MMKRLSSISVLTGAFASAVLISATFPGQYALAGSGEVVGTQTGQAQARLRLAQKTMEGPRQSVRTPSSKP